MPTLRSLFGAVYLETPICEVYRKDMQLCHLPFFVDATMALGRHPTSMPNGGDIHPHELSLFEIHIANVFQWSMSKRTSLRVELRPIWSQPVAIGLVSER